MSNTKTHWLKNPNKNYLGHWDLPNGEDLVLTIKTAKWEFIDNPKSRDSQGNPMKEEKRIVRWEEKGFKPFICNEGNASAIVKSTGVKYLEDSAGCRVRLFVGKFDDKFNKEIIDCVRVRASEQLNIQQIEKKLSELFENKKIKVDQQYMERIQKVIDEKETLSYDKIFAYLNSLK